MPPLACTLTADQLRCDAAVLLPGLQTRATHLTWLPEGMQLIFEATTDNLSAILGAVERERRCCAFFTFELLVPSGGQPVVLKVHGPEGTRDFLEQLGLRSTDT